MWLSYLGTGFFDALLNWNRDSLQQLQQLYFLLLGTASTIENKCTSLRWHSVMMGYRTLEQSLKYDLGRFTYFENWATLQFSEDEKTGAIQHSNRLHHREFPQVPSNKSIDHDLSQHSLVHLIWMRTGYDGFSQNMNQMGLTPSASCVCTGELARLDETAHTWLQELECND